MGFIQFFKRHRKSTDILLLVFLLGNLILLGIIISSSFNNDFVVNVIERENHLIDTKQVSYHIEQREVYGQLKFKSEKILDYVFLNKVPDANLITFLFSAFIIFQVMRIKSLWYHQYFTKKLYANIDALGFIAFIMFIFSRVQERYIKHLVNEISNAKLIAETSSVLLTISVVVMLLSNILKSFAKQGNILQEERDLTI